MWRKGAALIAICLLATGCWNKRELEEFAFVLALGIDKGTHEQYAVTASIAIPSLLAGKEGAAAKGGQEQPLVVTTVEAPTIAVALQMIDTWVDRRVSLLHAKTVFMSEEQARLDATAPIRQLARFREGRRTMFFVITRGKASEFLEKMDTRLERDPQRYIQQMSESSRYTGFLPQLARLQDALTQIAAQRRAPLVYYAAIRDAEKEEEWSELAKPESPQHEGAYVSGELPRKGGPNIDMMGSAVLDQGKMAGLLTGQENRWVLLLNNRFRRGYITVTDPKSPDQRVTLDIRIARAPRFTVRTDSKPATIDIQLPLEGEIISIGSATDYTVPDQQALLERSAAEQLQSQVRALVDKAQQELRVDVLGLGQQVARQFTTVGAWERYDWPARFPDAKINVSVQVALRRYGTQLAPPTR